jgi:hypothetical protein
MWKGTPLLNERGKVIALSLASNQVNDQSYFIILPKNLNDIINLGRGDIGISIDFVSKGVAERNYNVTQKIYAENFPENILIKSKEQTELLMVSSIKDNSTSSGILKNGDIILKAGNEYIGNDLYKLDSIINQMSFTNKTLPISVSRNGFILNYSLQVPSYNGLLKSYSKIGKNYFFTLQHELFDSQFDGVVVRSNFLNKENNLFKILSNSDSFVITAINSNKISNLESFINILIQICTPNFYLQGIWMRSNDFQSVITEINFKKEEMSIETYSLNSTLYYSQTNKFNLFDKCIETSNDYVQPMNLTKAVYEPLKNHTIISDSLKDFGFNITKRRY